MTRRYRHRHTFRKVVDEAHVLYLRGDYHGVANGMGSACAHTRVLASLCPPYMRTRALSQD